MASRPGWLILLAAMIAGVMALPAPAVATSDSTQPQRTTSTMGSSLDLPANNPYPCEYFPYVGSIYVIPSFQSTCTWIGIGSLMDSSGNFIIPVGGGTVTKVRIRVGATTGRMQIAVLGMIREWRAGTPGAYFLRRTSQVFTPAPNSVTEIDVNLPMTHQWNPITNAWDYDTLALSVLDPGVPMPAYMTGTANPMIDPAIGALYPAVSPTVPERVDTHGFPGFVLLMQADYTTNAEATPTVTLGRATVVAGKVRVPVRCTGDSGRCAGSVRLERGAKAVVLGESTFRVTAGKAAVVTVSLNAKGRRATAKGAVTVRVVAYPTGADRVLGGTVRLPRTR